MRPTTASLVIAVSVMPGLAQAACPKPTSTVDVIEHVEASGEAYKNADLVGFVQHTTHLEAAIDCLDEALDRNLTASVHRMMGLRAFVDQKSERAEQAFTGARAIEPDYRFPESMVSPNHPIMKAYEARSVEQSAEVKPVPAAKDGYFQFDGRPSEDRPSQVPTVAQLFTASGAVQRSAYLWPADGMFDYELGEPAAPPGPSVIDNRKRGPNVPLAIGAGGAAVLSGVAYALAASSAAQYSAPDTAYGDGSKLVSKNHTFTVVSGGAGAVAVGLGVGAVLAGRW